MFSSFRKQSFINDLERPRSKSCSSVGSTINISAEILKLKSENKVKRVKEYVLGEKLGSGAFAKVYEAVHEITLQKVAIKIISKKKLSKVQNGLENLKNEIAIMRELRHPNVLQLIDAFENEEGTKIYMIIEVGNAGSLQDIMNAQSDKRLPLQDAWKFFKQLVDGVEYTHQQGVIHRDIKPANLMITTSGVLKLADFGVAYKLGKFDDADTLTTTQGTPAFQCPQIAAGLKEYSGFATDVWAMGVTLYYMITGKLPFNGDTVFELYENIAKGHFEIPSFIEKDLQDLLRGMLCKDEKERFTIQQIKESAWYRKKILEGKKPFTIKLIDGWKSYSLLSYIEKAVH